MALCVVLLQCIGACNVLLGVQKVTAGDRIVSLLLRPSQRQTGHRVLDIGNCLRPRPPVVGIPRTGVTERKTARQHYAPRCDAMQSAAVVSVADIYCLTRRLCSVSGWYIDVR